MAHTSNVFLSTLPARGATYDTGGFENVTVISIHAPREGSDAAAAGVAAGDGAISIHAPREGSDAESASGAETARQISIHAPREGSDAGPWMSTSGRTIFLSTLPARGATRSGLTAPMPLPYFYPRSPRGERQIGPYSAYAIAVFLSTLPARGATGHHFWVRRGVPDFYPRSPRGERHKVDGICFAFGNFYPRSPRGERRCHLQKSLLFLVISIHAPREGSDGTGALTVGNLQVISIHAPREGSDRWGSPSAR